MRNGQKGLEGERAAGEFLARERGYRVIERNWRDPSDRRSEIDLVCLDGEAVVFVEVKARAAGAAVPGYFAVDARKRRALRRAAAAYLRGCKPAPRTFRLDVVEVELRGDGPPGILHFEAVPLFDKGRGWA